MVMTMEIRVIEEVTCQEMHSRGENRRSEYYLVKSNWESRNGRSGLMVKKCPRRFGTSLGAQMLCAYYVSR